jgi:hypothetical protein
MQRRRNLFRVLTGYLLPGILLGEYGERHKKRYISNLREGFELSTFPNPNLSAIIGPTNVAAELVANIFVIRRPKVQITARRSADLTANPRGFRQFIQAQSEVVPQIIHDHFHPHTFQIMSSIHSVSRHYIV